MKRFFSYFIILFYPFLGFCQTIFYDQLDLKSGLPSSVVYDIFQDSKGFIWIATDEGLHKYNGYDFQSYTHPDLHSKSGSNIKEDALGRIWYQTFDGFLFFVDKKNQLHTFHQKNNIGFVNFVVTKKYLIKTTRDGIEIRNLKNLKVVKTINIPKIETSYLELAENKIIYGNSKTETITLKEWQREEILNTPLKKASKILTFRDSKQLYFLTQESNFTCKLYSFYKNVFREVANLKMEKNVQNFEIIDKTIWLCTKNGTYAFALNGEKQTFTSKLPSEDISKVFKDVNRTYWFTSLSKGIFIIKNFKTIELQNKSEKFISVSADESHVFASTSSGRIYQLDTMLSSKLYWKNKDAYPIYYINFDSDSKYCYFSGNGFYALDKKNNKNIYHFNSAVKQIIPFKDNLFLTTGTGFVNTVAIHPEVTWKTNLLTNIRGKSITYDRRNNRILVATNNGLLAISNKKTQSLEFQNKPLYVKSLHTEIQHVIALSNQGELYKILGDSIFKIAENHFFTLLKKDKFGTLLANKNTLFRLENNTVKKLYSVGKFLNIKDFVSFKKHYYILTEDKIIRFNHEDNTKTFSHKPRLFIETTWVNGQNKPLNKASLNVTENDIQINCNLLNFDFDRDYELVYSLNGTLKKLNSFSKSIKLVALAPDKYTIKVGIQEKNNNNVEFLHTISFEILPPFWKRAWFILTFLFLLSTIVYTSYRLKIREIKEKNKKEVEKLKLENNLKESRLQLIKSQMNPHFFFNAINNIQSYIFTNETKEASIYLSKFSKLTRKILEFSEVNFITLKDEIDSLQLYLELQQMRFKDLKFVLNFDAIENPEIIKIPTMLFQPYVENAILHGLSHSNNEKKLEITFFWETPKILVGTIKDNGIGRVKSNELNQLNALKPTSFATKANFERIMLLNKDQYKIDVNYKDLYNQNLEALGTLVTIKIKL